MDIEDIKQMIRQSLREQVKNLIKERLTPPSSFEKFNFFVNESLEESEDRLTHDEVYGMWRSISAEVSDIQDERERISEWNLSLSYYVNNLDASKRTKTVLFNNLKR